MRGGVKTPWIRPRKYWFVLTPDSLDYYSSNEKGARRLGSLVLTSLCSVLWPDKQTYKETGRVSQPSVGLCLCSSSCPVSPSPPREATVTQRRGWGSLGQRVSCLSLAGYWSVTVFGRKHCYRLYTEHLNEAVHWVCAVQKVIDSKAPVQTPTQLLMRDVEVSLWPHSHQQGWDGRFPSARAGLSAAQPLCSCCHCFTPSGALRQPRGPGADLPLQPHPALHQQPPLRSPAALPLWEPGPKW